MPRSPGSAGNIFQTAFLWKETSPSAPAIPSCASWSSTVSFIASSPAPSRQKSSLTMRAFEPRTPAGLLSKGPWSLTPSAPSPKNPLIASFFVRIGLAEELGSGTRELFKNSRLYTGRDPELEEGLIFRAFVPTVPAANGAQPAGQHTTQADEPDEAVALALKLAESAEGVRTADLANTGISRRTALRIISELVEQGKLAPQGNGRSRVYRRCPR